MALALVAVLPVPLLATVKPAKAHPAALAKGPADGALAPNPKLMVLALAAVLPVPLLAALALLDVALAPLALLVNLAMALAPAAVLPVPLLAAVKPAKAHPAALAKGPADGALAPDMMALALSAVLPVPLLAAALPMTSLT